MDTNDQNEFQTEVQDVPKRSSSGRKLFRIAGGAALFGLGLSVGGFFLQGTTSQSAESTQNSFFVQTASVISKTLHDAFISEPSGHVYEIEVSDSLTSSDEKASSGVSSSRNDSTKMTTSGFAVASPKKSSSKTTSPPPSRATSPSTTKKSTSTSKTETASPIRVCDFTSSGAPNRTIIFSEVAWMGSPIRGTESASAASSNEWLELKNNSNVSVDLRGYHIISSDGKLNIVFNAALIVPAGGYVLLERTDDESVPGVRADLTYAGSLGNDGEYLKLVGGNCELVDEVNAGSGWLAGESESRKTMERNASDLGWHTSTVIGGTPRAQNSQPAPATPTSSPVVPPPPAPVQTYRLSIIKEGSGKGTVQTDDNKILCGLDCTEDYAVNTTVTLTAHPDPDFEFSGWTGACTGKGSCGVFVTGAASVTAVFNPPQFSGSPPPPPPPSAPGSVLVSEIMAGSDGNADNEFIELYNPGSSGVVLTGWTIKKKSSTGTESTLVAASRLEGKTIMSNKYFLIGHEGGYAGATTPDMTWPVSYSLAYTNNAILLYDANGAKTEEVHWDEIQAGQSLTRSSWTSSDFAAATPSPQNSQ